MQRTGFWPGCVGWLMLAAGLMATSAVSAIDPATVAAVTRALPEARPALSHVVGLGRAVVDLPVHAVRVLYLPLGVVECVGAPLPGVSFMSGLSHIGSGVLAPFRLLGNVITFPAKVVETVEAVATAIPRAASAVP
ncbi:MAG: hypothetical protein FJ222_01625 [Lentisphaerae bacterium]|nr:hypothetical protein [Lentisphaerota bacterium]